MAPPMASTVQIDIKELRKAKQLTIRAAAAEIGVPFTTLARVERKGSRPVVQTAQRIADFYGLPVSAIWPVEERVA